MEWGGSLLQYNCYFYKQGKFGHKQHTRRMPCEDEDRDQAEASTSQRRPKIACKPPAARGEAWTDSSSQPSERTNPVDTLTSDV